MNSYILKHKNISAALLEINPETARLQRFKPLEAAHMPFLGNADLRKLAHWWDNRSVPDTREDLAGLLKDAGCHSPEDFMVKNLALSLTDCYWICPQELSLRWEDVSLYTGHKGVSISEGEKEGLSHSPNSTLGGALSKQWEIDGNRWFLHKKSATYDGQQSVNEAFASWLHKRQGFQNYVEYTLPFPMGGKCRTCVCEAFTSEQMEFISAYEVVGGEKKPNDISMYDFYVSRCAAYGLQEKEVRDFLDYQTESDYLITNTDRHLRNFGILRDPDTLEVKGCAPIFDSGNSMFYNALYAQSYEELAAARVTSFAATEAKMLSYVQNRGALNLENIPNQREVMNFYAERGIPETKAEIIAGNYQKKKELLMDFQRGVSISVYYGKRKDAKKALESNVQMMEK